MNYAKVLNAASKNNVHAGAYLNTKLPPPKKMKKEKKGVESAAVRAFLQKKEEEEKQKAIAERKKKLELRKKRVEGNTQKKANAMASRTKDNLKVMKEETKTEEEVKVRPEDLAKKSGRKAHAVSTDWLKKREEILEKMKRPKEEKIAPKLPEAPPDMREKSRSEVRSGDSDRHKSRDRDGKSSQHHSDKSHKHSNSHHKSKHKHKHKRSSRERERERDGERTGAWVSVKPAAPSGDAARKPPPKPKNRKPMPPPMSYEDILRLAQNPGAADPKAPGKQTPPKKKEREERPMTQDEKERAERKKSKEYQHWLKFGGKMPSLSSDEPVSSAQVSKSDVTARASREQVKTESQGAKGTNISAGKTYTSQNVPQFDKAKALARIKGAADAKPKCASSSSSARAQTSQSGRPGLPPGGKQGASPPAPKRGRAPEPEAEETPRKKVKQDEPQISTWDRIYGQMHQKKPKPAKRQMVIESDSEYDSEMDDFIDDGDVGDDYSSAIRDIFGYDKRKYRYEDDDIDDMEAGFGDVEREEAVSARIGYMEDLEDIKKEEEEKRQKMLRMKKMKRR